MARSLSDARPLLDVPPQRYSHSMARRIWTAEEFAALTPAQQDEEFDAAVVSDLDEVPAELLNRARARLQERIDSAPPR